ncbi:cyclin-A2-1-like [Iris pallida]|uniref:Cyclin-A2-1-like n=1 Tax=Iris pallida TaxID=29817 RepID=A0AAX6GGF4_IRIPA|nr:cyclin-A2-1-like [Iris pallida]
MKKENSVLPGCGVPTGRITRARAAACRVSGGVLSLNLPLRKLEKNQVQRGKTKRDENSYAAPTAAFQNKKRAVLRDVTDVCCGNSYKDCINAAKLQTKAIQRVKLGPSRAKLCAEKKTSNSVPTISHGSALVHEEAKNMTEDIPEVAMVESQVIAVPVKVEDSVFGTQNMESHLDGECTCETDLFDEDTSRKGPELFPVIKNVKAKFSEDPGGSSCMDFIDIDSDHKSTQLCCIYSSDIYFNLRGAELIRRPCSNFMETLQRDISHSMRGILIDWLVEVSDEYKLVPDTLYLTVNIIDRYLSKNHIERQKLQILGITCMLIASKYEEIIAPRVEEFCFITDNMYSKEEVLKMEIQILSILGYQLSVPTVKTFLRRFIRAAQSSHKAPLQPFAHLANYFAELTLIEYSFLKFLPSVIAASAVFLARWTLEQSGHPWNQTLEHYTSYKASDLKVAVHAMQDLQMNSNKCPLNAIREKYKLPKFESVAAMSSPELLPLLFC